MAFNAERQFLVSIAGLAGSFWAQTSGGDASVAVTKAYDGGNPAPQILTGNPTVDDLVVTRNYDSSRDGPIAQQLLAGLMAGNPLSTTISQDPTDPAYRPTGDPPITWTGKLTKVTTPKANGSTGSATPSTLALTFTCTRVQ